MRSNTPAELAELVKDLRAQVTLLEADLTAQAAKVEFDTRLREEYAQARVAKRTAAVYPEWLKGRVTQAAAAWVLGTVFVRYCEDNELVEWPFLAGPGDRLADAEDRRHAYFTDHPHENDTAWLLTAFDHLAQSHPTVAGLFDRAHNPLWDITISYEAAATLQAFWRRRGPDGEVRWHFDGWDTRFLGDLYQDLSEFARRQYALLQTPEFVEEFILNLTFNPAIEEFGLEGLRTIDPTCGSGHFVLGLFQRILTAWRGVEPGTDDWTLIRRTLGSVHGVDKNPFAVSIARFRLLVAVLAEAGEKRLANAREFPINLAVGDSLIHGRGAPRLQKDDDTLDISRGEDGEDEPVEHTYTTEDVNEFLSDGVDMLGRQSYHVVVGNPPYITVKDKGENENYRTRPRYSACSGSYALSVPFAQRFFDLAIKTGGADPRAGYVGQITANSFMKREFGKKLIEEFFTQSVHLTHVIDTSGAYIPGHGTPTVILIGRNHIPYHSEPIRAVLGIRGEPSQPDFPEESRVWRAIMEQIGTPGSNSEWISVEDVDRSSYSSFPWSLTGGGAAAVFAAIASGRRLLRERASSVGRTTATGADEVFLLPDRRTAERFGDAQLARPLVIGENVRDFLLDGSIWVRNPYVDARNERTAGDEDHLVTHTLWPFREILQRRVIFGKTIVENGHAWYCHLENYSSKLATRFGIGFSFVATHNHFAIDRSGRLFNRTAPVIKLPKGATEDDHLELLGVLNSSAACFWLKQVCHDKGIRGEGGGFTASDWERFYEFTGTKLQEFPLPRVLPLELGRRLDHLAQRLTMQEPATVCVDLIPTRTALDAARRSQEHLRRRMIGLQEELDWAVYHSYDLLTEAERQATTVADLGAVPEVSLGERAFEIVLARKVAAGESETAWFERHGSIPITEVPARWPDAYRAVVQSRIDLIEKRRDLALIERPECKRRWSIDPWEKREREALRTWLLDRCERRDLWYGLREGFRSPLPMTVSQVADRFRDDVDMQAVAQLFATDHLGRRDATLADVLVEVIADEHVPYLAALRYKDSGLGKRTAWEHIWDLQREEDRRSTRLDIPVPPKYGPTDFRKPSYWSQRGKLDVPKERFISYPEAGPDADPTLLLGWAGWDHKDQAAALVGLITDRATDAGWGPDRIKPLLAGVLEVLPWVRQWHDGDDPEWGGNPAEEIAGFLTQERTKRGFSDQALREWRPQPGRRGRKASRSVGADSVAEAANNDV